MPRTNPQAPGLGTTDGGRVTHDMATAALAARVPGTDYFVRDFFHPLAAPASRRAVVVAAIEAALAAAQEATRVE